MRMTRSAILCAALFASCLLALPAKAQTVTCSERACSDWMGATEKATHALNRSRTHHAAAKRQKPTQRASGLITIDTAANIKITVHPYYADKFRSFIAELVAQGHKPRFITCYARGHKSGSNHAWGGACDIDQTGWGRTSSFMYHAKSTIHSAGLYDGCSFGDCGHVEAMRGLHNRPPNIYAAVAKFKSERDNAPIP